MNDDSPFLIPAWNVDLEVMIGNIKHYELLIIAILTGAGVLIWLVHFANTKRSRS